MSIYFISDHHFGHAGALGHYRLPFASVAEMDRQMIDRWNSVVGADDEVWHLGDFALRQRPDRVAALVKALHGRKHLITGTNDDAAVNGCDGWESVQPYAEVSVDGMHLVGIDTLTSYGPAHVLIWALIYLTQVHLLARSKPDIVRSHAAFVVFPAAFQPRVPSSFDRVP
jgi:hypothetical protein